MSSVVWIIVFSTFDHVCLSNSCRNMIRNGPFFRLVYRGFFLGTVYLLPAIDTITGPKKRLFAPNEI